MSGIAGEKIKNWLANVDESPGRRGNDLKYQPPEKLECVARKMDVDVHLLCITGMRASMR